jgi:hypothetical protein
MQQIVRVILKNDYLKLIQYLNVIINCEIFSCYLYLLKGTGKLSMLIRKYLDTHTIWSTRLVEALHNKPEDRGFDSRFVIGICH